MRNYDLVYVIRPDLETEAVQAAIERMTSRITDQGGTVEVVDVWGKKRMAFAIHRHRDGVFVHTRFALDTNKLDEIRRAAALSEDVLRATVTTAVGPTPQPKTAAPAQPAPAPAQAAPAPAPAAAEQKPAGGETPAAASSAAGPEPSRETESAPEPAPEVQH